MFHGPRFPPVISTVGIVVDLVHSRPGDVLYRLSMPWGRKLCQNSPPPAARLRPKCPVRRYGVGISVGVSHGSTPPPLQIYFESYDLSQLTPVSMAPSSKDYHDSAGFHLQDSTPFGAGESLCDVGLVERSSVIHATPLQRLLDDTHTSSLSHAVHPQTPSSLLAD